MSRKVLIVSPEYPPCSLAGVHRTRLLANYLERFGWEPIVLTVREDAYDRDLDPELLSLVHAHVRVERVGAAPAKWTRRVGIGDISLRAWWAMAAAAKQIIRRDKPALLFATVLPTYHTLFVARLACRNRLPFVLDYQDPWVSSTPMPPSWGTKRGWSQRIARCLEPRVVRWTSHVTAVSDRTWEMLRERHPQLPSEHFTTIPIGGDEADFRSIRQEGPSKAPDAVRPIRFVYVGTIWPEVLDTLRTLLAALRDLKTQSPATYARIRVDFIGTTAGAPDQIRPQVAPLAADFGVDDVVHESPARIPYLRALREMVAADVLLIMGSNQAHYTASKLYPSLLSGNRVLAIVHEASEVTHYARLCGGVRLINFTVERPVADCRREIFEAFQDMTLGRDSTPKADLTPIRSLLAEGIAERFADVFNLVAKTGFTGPMW